jgi:hypothetical protein
MVAAVPSSVQIGRRWEPSDLLNVALPFGDGPGDGRPPGLEIGVLFYSRCFDWQWPVVIPMDLDSKVKNRLWGLTVLQREDGFDINEPLAGRRLRYWPKPFGGH